MSDQSPYGLLLTSDSKKRKLEGEVMDSSHVGADRSKGTVDRAKANYLSGQLRLRLQYAKLKVEHGWQRQSLSEVENLYFRHTHLTRPYPVISPGGRRNGRTLSHNGALNATASHAGGSSMTSKLHPDQATSQSGPFSVSGPNSGLRNNGSLASSCTCPRAHMYTAPHVFCLASSSSLDTSANPSIPTTPILNAGHPQTPHAPHLGLSGSVTRYPISRSDSTATVIIESAPSLTTPRTANSAQAHHTTPSSGPLSSHTVPQPSAASPFREPFDPMEPTEHIDSQLAALRTMMTTSAMPIPLPPPQTSPTASLPPNTSANGNSGSGLTYDAFWSTHSSATSYRVLLASQGATQGRSSAPLQAYASAPAALPTSSTNHDAPNGTPSRAHP
ncbi:hypothetical protein C2E23DRAFT_493904 [Lenzites betulinus]|nr:hypothetical protein C2E23DRAFT_493904 [Lenzites betulinus]